MIDHPPKPTFVDEAHGKESSFSFAEYAFNIFNHFTYHRGQLVLALRMLGKEVTYTDYVPYRFHSDHGIVLKD
ncbi:MAG: DinB family protein [Candidatus Kariarchaeaceae archaeon]|jgi:uncharacterized damage-inducible protein DinB